MKKIILMILALLSTVVFTATSYSLPDKVYPFGDNSYYWGDGAGWASAWNTDVANGLWDGNNIDVIGDPNITGGTATFNDQGNLKRITFNYYTPYDDWRMLAPGNLFINVMDNASDTNWDYVVPTMGNAKANTNNKNTSPLPSTLSFANYKVYAIGISAQPGVNDVSYELSGADNTGYWAGYYLRNNHPIGLKDVPSNEVGPAFFSGFPGIVTGTQAGESTNDNGNPNHQIRTSYYDFTGPDGNGTGSLYTGNKDIIIGWEMTCANDVIYEQVGLEHDTVPEPATLLLLGLGLIGIGAISRRTIQTF